MFRNLRVTRTSYYTPRKIKRKNMNLSLRASTPVEELVLTKMCHQISGAYSINHEHHVVAWVGEHRRLC